MPSVLITAFEPYGQWKENSSWLALVELTKNLPETPAITTRLYPVDFQIAKQKLEKDLVDNYDYALHFGQAPDSSHIRLEAIGLNIGGEAEQNPEARQPLVQDAPVA